VQVLVLVKSSSVHQAYLRIRSTAVSPEPAAEHSLPNHLISEKSPYLQQHAHNPVDWYPWGDEAFRQAADKGRPIFLSIGYATCHWCHVMAHESFEDPGIAAVLNTHFIAIKVDREERPDIDSIYMIACQQMTGQGGWPLTIIMTPDKKPFFAGTYLPRTSRAGMTGLAELLEKVIRLWREEREMLTTAAEELTSMLAEPAGEPAEGTADQSLLRHGYDELVLSFDPDYGGFGRAPKFPTPAKILFLMRSWKRGGSVRALRMAEKTLEALRCGGIHDHLGGGFHRYSTDTQWRIPHFEKMLYDQALITTAFTEAWLATRKPVYRQTAEAIIEYVTRDLTSPEGAFISAEDADSAGGEGAFYLWTRKELDHVLGPSDGSYAASLFHITEAGNFPATEAGPGKNILYLQSGTGENPVDMSRRADIRRTLLAERQKRPRPQRDGKILTDWNGLMIAALAQSSRAFGAQAYYQAAETAQRFILDRLRTPDGGLLHRYCDGEAAITAFAQDYAYLIRALLELYTTSFDPVWLEEAILLDQYLSRHFSDSAQGGFFTTSDKGEFLIARTKEIYDGALPSCNSVMLGNLVLLEHLTGNEEYEERASRLADAFAGTVRQSPSAYCAYLSSLDHLLGPAMDVVIAGEGSDPVAMEMIRLVFDRYLPSVTVHFRTPLTSSALEVVAPFIRNMSDRDGKTTAYLCAGRSCSAPLSTPKSLQELLEKNE
jgi:uncharacterized protein YyaL (SSP411 family)